MNKKLKLDALGRLLPEAYKNVEKSDIIIILDNIRSAHNVGSFFRTADAFRVQHIYLCGITPQPPHRDIRKTALGATKTIDWTHFENTAEAIQEVQKRNFTIASIEQTEASIELQSAEFKGKKWAFIFGNEVDGVNQKIIDMSDLCIEIPQFGTKHSFNVSISGGIILWEAYRSMYID